MRKRFPIEEALITAKYLSHCQVSWCQAAVVINIYYDRNSKSLSFCFLINVPIWSVSSINPARLQSLTIRLKDKQKTPGSCQTCLRIQTAIRN